MRTAIAGAYQLIPQGAFIVMVTKEDIILIVGQMLLLFSGVGGGYLPDGCIFVLVENA